MQFEMENCLNHNAKKLIIRLFSQKQYFIIKNTQERCIYYKKNTEPA